MVTDDTSLAPPPDQLTEIREVVGRAKRGDAAAVPRLRELLDRHPALWAKYGDLAAQVQLSWIGLAAGGDLHLKESVSRYTERLRAELIRPAALPVEKLLVERAVATWLQLNYFSGVEANAIAGDASPRMLQLRARRHAQAQRQHERALSALVAIQKLYPNAPVQKAVPVTTSATAEVAVAADRGQRFNLPATVVTDEIGFDEGESGFRPAERVSVGVAS